MAVNKHNIIKWYKMLTGKSILHVNQGMGKMFQAGELKGYFNDLTEKVIKESELLETDELPQVVSEKGEKIFFPVAIFQYGLGAYDLFLQSGETKYLNKCLQCANWAIANIEEKGAWNNFFFFYPDHPYGAMCQGEGISLLMRAYKETTENRYLEAARKAVDFMCKSIEEGGTIRIIGDDMELLEYTHRKPVLNGWIFALFGLYDYLLVERIDEVNNVFCTTIKTLKKYMVQFDAKYWSIYDLEGRISSPFYHNLHIAQMQAMYEITGDELFHSYNLRWAKQQNSILCSTRAFIRKAIQKILEKE